MSTRNSPTYDTGGSSGKIILPRQLHVHILKAIKDGDDVLPTASPGCMASKVEPGEQEGKGSEFEYERGAGMASRDPSWHYLADPVAELDPRLYMSEYGAVSNVVPSGLWLYRLRMQRLRFQALAMHVSRNRAEATMGVECIGLVTRFASGGCGSRVSRAWSEYEAASAWHVGSGIGRGVATASDYYCIDRHCNGHNSFAPGTNSVKALKRENPVRESEINTGIEEPMLATARRCINTHS
ncbi:hypothetical protein ARMGADRAFT_1079987 [Armillaria gallica]|uniref:Uncharacterized protein n=1 Tax=Armillaria gallica TaxID=47427 RepID=A0A2H3DEP6_ARMGA|nr:hypothetical protein ARMGADRAFT_1079987 [Armillaria gallica]